jgi:hypothetical protein
MIKTLVACTAEVDDVHIALDEIRTQLDMPHNLMKNAVGIIACHYEFVFSGMVKAIAEALPFDVVGTITSAQAVRGEAGTLLLSLMVLTSDDVSFVTRLTPSLLGEPAQTITRAYQEAAAGQPQKPALIFTFAPFIMENSGDEYVNVFTQISGGAPCFGTLAVDDTLNFANCFLLYNGEHYPDRMGFILLYGDVTPKFYIATISPAKILEKEALVTKSAGHVLMEVNERPVVEYFEDLGLTKAAETQYAMTSLPFMLDYGDGTPPVSKVFIKLTPEKYAICAGAMPEGAKMKIGIFDRDDVLFTSGAALDDIARDTAGGSGGLLIYSCISRNKTLGADMLAEGMLVREKAGGQTAFMMAYSGGEICPTQVSAAKAINRFHNNAFIACVF